MTLTNERLPQTLQDWRFVKCMRKGLNAILLQQVTLKIFVNRFDATVPLQVQHRQFFHQRSFLFVGNSINIIRSFHLMPELAIDTSQSGKDRSNITFDFREGIPLLLVNFVCLEFESFLAYRTVVGVADKL